MAITKIDQNDPLYIGHSDTSGAVLIPIKLTGSENYGIWSRSIRIALLGKRKYGFVTGACTRALYKDELHEQWETCNAIVLSWLMNTVSEDLLSGIVYATTAFSVWADLKEQYDKVNRMRIYQLYREITTLTQARRQILLKGTTPAINQAYAIIIDDEIQQLNYVANFVHKPDPMIMNVHKNQGKEYYKGRKCESFHFTDHTKENYKLIGYPDDWKHRKKSSNMRNTSGDYGKQFPTNNVRNSAGSSHYAGQHSANHATCGNLTQSQEILEENSTLQKGHAFTDQEYKQVMEMLKKC
ncbi:hypothetical protein KY289_005085 [Solanum tuberosum]|nr:hypothetical protein KY289_005085 [Solanum tuberosum]